MKSKIFPYEENYDKGCEGCYTKKLCVLSNRQMSKCPCKTCVVKIVCTFGCRTYQKTKIDNS